MALFAPARSRIRWIALAAALLSWLALAASHAGSAGAAPTLGPAALSASQLSVVVQFEPGANPRAAMGALRRTGVEITPYIPVIDGVGALVPATALDALRALPEVRAVTLNAPVGPRSLPKPSTLKTAYNHSVDSLDAWKESGATGRGVAVAVVDTGIAGDLPDFRRDARDARSRVVASVVTNPRATTAADTYGHGTHVAGIVAGNGANRAAGDPLRGAYAGVAPEADLVSVKVSDDDGAASVLDVIYGLQFVADHADDYDIRVVNLSLESSEALPYTQDPLDAAVESLWFQGIVVVAAAGNRGTGADAVRYAPANDPYVISVGAVDDGGSAGAGDDRLAPWSSRGTTQDGFRKPEVHAPGAKIVSSLAPGSAFAEMCPSCVVGGQYIRAGGTSMAAPMVAGIVADLLQARPGLTPDEVKGLLIESSRSVPGGVLEPQAQAAIADRSFTAANAGLTPNPQVDTSTGSIDYTASRWSASRWSTASGSLVPSYGGDAWTCDCSEDVVASVDPSASRWSASRWSTAWDK